MQAHFTPLLKPTNLLTSSLLFGSSLPDVADGSLWDHLLPPWDMCLHQIVEEKEKLIILFQTWGAHKTEQASGNIIFRVHALVLQVMFIHSFIFDRFIQQRVTEGPCLWLYLQILLSYVLFFKWIKLPYDFSVCFYRYSKLKIISVLHLTDVCLCAHTRCTESWT